MNLDEDGKIASNVQSKLSLQDIALFTWNLHMIIGATCRGLT